MQTKLIIYSFQKKKKDYEIIFHNRVLKKKKSYVYIDHKLSWEEHISNVCITVSKCIAVINNVKYVLRKDFLSSPYTSIIESHLTYCVEVWGNAYKSNMNPLI